MTAAGHWQCEECGPIPAMKHTPTKCPICGREIFWRADESKRFPTSAERAAEWFQKMREAVNEER